MAIVEFSNLPKTEREILLTIMKLQPDLLPSFIKQGKSAKEAVAFITEFFKVYAEQIKTVDLSDC